jgi:DNA-binding GntR family transcriptional regulator
MQKPPGFANGARPAQAAASAAPSTPGPARRRSNPRGQPDPAEPVPDPEPAATVDRVAPGHGADPVAPLERPASLRQIVYDALTRLIIAGSLRPGQHLAEPELARQFGVSRQPVREALHLLQADGWVDLRPTQGAFVHQPTDDEVDQLLSTRSLLETETARLAAKAATPEHIQRLRELLDEGNEALRRQDIEHIVTLNSALHAVVTAASGNKVLADLIALIDRRMRWYYTPIAGSRAAESWHEHAELVDAVAAGNPQRAAAVMRRHTELTRRAYQAHRSRAGQPR